MLKICVNGARSPAEHQALPVTSEDIAGDVAAARGAGVDAAHVHVKDLDGTDTLDASALGEVLTALHAAAPGFPVGVTTGAWAVSDPAERVASIRSWGALRRRPDFASVNWHEEGADAAAAALQSIGVGIEAGLWHADAVRAWSTSTHRDKCLRVLLELPDGTNASGVDFEARRLLAMVREVSEDVPVLLHGEGSSTWPALRLATWLGLSTRIGLEDVLVLPDGSPAENNLALVMAAKGVQASAAKGASGSGRVRSQGPATL